MLINDDGSTRRIDIDLFELVAIHSPFDESLISTILRRGPFDFFPVSNLRLTGANLHVFE